MPLVLENAAVIGNELALSFADGLEVYLPLPMLRRACPCAVCQGEPDALGRVVRPKVEHGPRAFDLVKFEPVGFVNTRNPMSESMEATMRVVVVLPFVPDTSTTP